MTRFAGVAPLEVREPVNPFPRSSVSSEIQRKLLGDLRASENPVILCASAGGLGTDLILLFTPFAENPRVDIWREREGSSRVQRPPECLGVTKQEPPQTEGYGVFVDSPPQTPLWLTITPTALPSRAPQQTSLG